MKEYKEFLKEWNNEMISFLNGKSLGNMKLTNIHNDNNDAIVEFQVNTGGTPDLQLNWMIINDYGPGLKPTVRIDISSPNKKGSFVKKATGKNAIIEGIWKVIQEIFENGK
jgi:hypothetical protein